MDNGLIIAQATTWTGLDIRVTLTEHALRIERFKGADWQEVSGTYRTDQLPQAMTHFASLLMTEGTVATLAKELRLPLA